MPISNASSSVASQTCEAAAAAARLSLPAHLFVIDIDLYLGELFDTFVAPKLAALFIPSLLALITHYYRRISLDITRKAIQYSASCTAPDIINIFIQVLENLGLSY